MVSKRKPCNIYPGEFKLEAIRLMNESDRPASQITMELGIRRNQLFKCNEQVIKTGDVASAKKGRPKKGDQSEVTKLRQELKRVKQENEILKKAGVGSTRHRKPPFNHLFRCISSDNHRNHHFKLDLLDFPSATSCLFIQSLKH